MNSRKIVSLLLVVIILATMLAACSGSATRAVPTTAPETKPFVVASDASFPPMEFVDETKAIVGFDIDMMNAVAAAMGFKVEYKNTAWDGIFAGLEGAAYDAVLSAVTITDERKQKYDFSEPYVNAGQIVVVRTDEMAITGDKTLAGKLVGAQIGTTGAFAVQKIEGAKPDVAFTQAMIAHHQGAIDMAKVILGFGTDPETRKLAQDVMTAQQGEIAFLQQWLARQSPQ